MKKPAGWPRYMIVKHLKNGPAYYWNPPKRDIDKGFPIRREKLGSSYIDACKRCDGDPSDPSVISLNRLLDDWRAGYGSIVDINLGPRFGTIDWWFEIFFRSTAFTRLSDRTQKDYRYGLRQIADLKTKTGDRLGQLPSKSIGAEAADRIYERLKKETGGERNRRANMYIDIARRAWKIVKRKYPEQFTLDNPFEGMIRERDVNVTLPASREQAYLLSSTLKKMGHQHLGAVPLICFEWLQRPENVLAGHLSWNDYRPKDHPNHVRIVHNKTREKIWYPLEDQGELLYPEIEEYLRSLPQIGPSLVLNNSRRGIVRPYSMNYARRRVREARKMAGLPNHITLAACRHGGMTELGDAELTEAQVMSLSAHKTPDAARIYIKRTEQQRITAARKRRLWIATKNE